MKAAAIASIREVSMEDDFYSVGGDSLTGVKIISHLQEAYNVPISIAEFFSARTLREMSDIFVRSISHASAGSNKIPALERGGQSFDAWLRHLLSQDKKTARKMLVEEIADDAN